ncbi:hypothetical protein [Leadbetterella byssophila]|uniref:Uncharacterized protein n=1 Tax=Leadbetterella byssophila (strain DSM 17132 / JCM 16389 / KACC 11308 / NBRC 106382 / 4M15) TaxID=649349 RepID=E4RTI6_LEAB4|nr:hypothetical protein [Leadbetterella byssophila]ADQ16843.1 hypothetical protein Lbys_1121 [Leadbetterella byssophila DSM 17132]
MRTLVILLTVFTTSLSTTFANDSARVQVKNTAEVVSTLNKKGKKLVKKNTEDLNLYLAVMDLYAKDPASFYNLDENTQKNFIAAANNLSKTFSESRNKEVKSIAEQIAFNQAVSTYIWNVKKANSVVLPLVDVPVQQTSL